MWLRCVKIKAKKREVILEIAFEYGYGKDRQELETELWNRNHILMDTALVSDLKTS